MPPLLPWLNGERRPDHWALHALLALLGGCGAGLGSFQVIRRLLYQHGVLPSLRPDCPVISVGNLTAGGTGKTPMVLWLARRLGLSGYRVAVVSRGYRQHSRARVTVVSDPSGVRLAPPIAADEAVLAARLVPGLSVLTGPDRPALIRHALQVLGCDLILMDDGFHRHDVRRDLDLVLLDARHPFGNGRLLPGGILREWPTALQRCDALILTRADDPVTTQATLAVLQQRFPDKPVLTAWHRPSAWIPVHPSGAPLPLEGVGGSGVAFCGIAAPEKFRQTLETLPIRIVDFCPFGDHHPFGEEECQKLNALAVRRGADFLVCTEKDAVKLEGRVFSVPLYALRVEMAVMHNRTWLEQRLACCCPGPRAMRQTAGLVRP